MTDFWENYYRRRETLSCANELNKALVFDELARAGITRVTVAFDGEGDSGQIELIVAHAGEATLTPLPRTPLTINVVPRNATMEINREETTLPEAIESLCYDYLAQEHDGWENNDGANGEFVFDVTARTVTLEFNGRFTDYHTETHSF
jgi:hypothetical protein